MSTSRGAIPAAIGGVIGVNWGLVLALATWGIYNDGEFKGGQLMVADTSLVLAGSLVMIAGGATSGRRPAV